MIIETVESLLVKDILFFNDSSMELLKQLVKMTDICHNEIFDSCPTSWTLLHFYMLSTEVFLVWIQNAFVN